MIQLQYRRPGEWFSSEEAVHSDQAPFQFTQSQKQPPPQACVAAVVKVVQRNVSVTLMWSHMRRPHPTAHSPHMLPDHLAEHSCARWGRHATLVQQVR